jgi:seryl-tRNA synthetase
LKGDAVMLDARFAREHIDIVKKSLENRNCSLSLDEFLKFEENADRFSENLKNSKQAKCRFREIGGYELRSRTHQH